MASLPDNIGESKLASTHPIVFDDERGYIVNDFSADQLNQIAEHAFKASRPLYEIARNGDQLVLSPEEVMRLGDHFEEIAFQLGDGVLFDAD
jgi:hypothetical protein